MNRVAAYLNEHLAGEVLTNEAVLSLMEQDGGVLSRRPEMVVRVAHVNDIRKILRFCSQLAEKGRKLPIVVRGMGTDATGGAVGEGIMIDMLHHMHRVIAVDARQRLVHAQAGAAHSAVNSALATHKALALPHISLVGEDGTVGGALSTGAGSFARSNRGDFGRSVQRLEVVLSNGDVIQTGPLSRRDLSKKIGQADFEGEIYRELDHLLTDEASFIEKLNPSHDMSGYAQIAKVRTKDGGFDLTPLFIGAQGSLGIISEVILKAEFVRSEMDVVIAAYRTLSDAQNAADMAVVARAAAVEVIDGRLLARAAAVGKRLDWAPPACFKGGVVLAFFDTFAKRNRTKAARRLAKKCSDLDALEVTVDTIASSELDQLHSPLAIALHPAEPGALVPRAFQGLRVPLVQIDSFLMKLKKLEAEHQLELPIYIDMPGGFIDLFPIFQLHKVSERRKLLTVLAAVSNAAAEHGGSAAAYGGDGRLKASFICREASLEAQELYRKIRRIFDPHGLCNPGIKQDVLAKDLASELNAWCRLQT